MALCATFLLVVAAQTAAAQTPWLNEDVVWPAQEPSAVPGPQAAAENAPPVALATIHGVVRNAATGQPLPRALVRIEGNADTGALTDGEGRFEIPGVPVGAQAIQVRKPGFHDNASPGNQGISMAHRVRVAAEMPDLALSLAPAGALSGRVTLSNGEPAEGVGLTLLKLTVEDGFAHWTEADSHQTTPEGEFRFSGLDDGSYTLMTQPEFDNERAEAPACNGPAPPVLPGYPVVFYPDSADAAGADRIELAGGRQAQANLTLSPGSFHAVQAIFAKPPGSGHWQFTSILTDRNGQKLDYPLRQNEKGHSLCAYLPDGAYTLAIQGSTDDEPDGEDQPLSRQGRKPKELAGLLDFAVDGPMKKPLRVPLSAGVTTPVHLRYEPGPPPARQAATNGEEVEVWESDPLDLWAARANGTAARGEARIIAEAADSGQYELAMASPGAYWISASANGTGTCLGAVTAGGKNLAYSPWIAGTLGTGAVIEAVVRTDCAKLTLQLPAGILAEPSGEDPTLFVYLIPEFESAQEIREMIVRLSDGAPGPLENLTPGSYRVLVFNSPRSLEYRNPAAMERFAGQGQQVTLPPGGSANLILEVPPL
jgi:hypothetical protein